MTFEKGESRIEPGTLPPRNVTYRLQTFSDFAFECGESRMWAGVHFQDAIDVIKPIAKKIARLATKLVLKYFNAEPAPVAPIQVPAHPYHQVPASEPLRIQELPPNPYQYAYPAATNPGYPGYPSYPSVTPAPHYETPVAPVAAPASPFAPLRTPKNLFSNHFSFSIGKK